MKLTDRPLACSAIAMDEALACNADLPNTQVEGSYRGLIDDEETATNMVTIPGKTYPASQICQHYLQAHESCQKVRNVPFMGLKKW